MITLKQQNLCRNYYISSPNKTPLHYQTQFRLYGLSTWDALRMLVELELKNGTDYIKTTLECDTRVTIEGWAEDADLMKRLKLAKAQWDACGIEKRLIDVTV